MNIKAFTEQHVAANAIECGAFSGLPFDAYKQRRGVNFSTLTTFARSPRDAHEATPRETTPAMQRGSTLHALITEQRADYVIKPDTYGAEGKKWNGNATECRAWMEAHAGRHVVTTAEAAELEACAETVREHQKAGQFVQHGAAEVSMFGFDTVSGLFLKGRADYVRVHPDHVCITDIKTTADASTAALVRVIQQRHYHVQAAMYRRLARLCGAGPVRYVIVAVEPNGAATKVNVRELNPRAIDRGDEILSGWLERYAECQQSGTWPEWFDEAPGIMPIDLPEWAYPETEIDMED